ncbi:Fes1-domain-containing protein [Dissoconium aciculare CBS 342.82]|uniref:Fes1-domain-containing protein n=1 Tax=Dissoconium aciculare CBS 342.82 TaxID=1314786 RepID=A0A6J3MHP7_9PEZI|nr:Fes1-domain-containing protein [Dissoconium aciculare CBS 342.82]KAF1827460.1 Fes1-domain-containing protein [Dissoconium aciculare CBS 342.82]
MAGSLNNLLAWSTANSVAPQDGSAPASSTPSSGLNAEMLAELLGGPSDADRMRDAMSAITLPLEQVSLENKLIAWDNLEQLIEQIDNANNMDPMGLWPPLLRQLENPEAELRRMAAWCASTAVQNNVKAQEKFLAEGGIPKLVKLATEDPVQSVRKKAITALSSAVRNFQPGLDELEQSVPDAIWTKKQGLDAADMEAVDEVISALRDHSASRS